ncbi:MAG: pyridoxal phosphate-dependent aminotransferase [Deltaproteobacteria bacterium]|nr:pyridoxal phosphate-dependent aminotransferase [Deltaproteobacteria bacterium]
MLRIKLSNRARQTPPSPIRKLAHLAQRAKRAGTGVYHLNIGQPDIESPEEFFEGLRLFKQKVVAYDLSQGNEALCSAWSRYVNKTLGLNTSPEEFLITMGASEALVFLFMTCCDPGDEVIIFDPTYANYIGFAAASGVTLVPVLSDMERNFALPPLEEIEAKMTNRTRAILLCSPNNPTGTVYTDTELKFLLDLCEENNIFLIVDETYREYVYDDLEPLSIFHLAPRNERVIVVDSLSKRFSLCGARIGCLLTTNPEVLSVTLNIAQARLAAPTIEQFASAYMLDHIKDGYLEGVRREYQARRDTLYQALSSVPGISAHLPKGAFYVIVRLPVDDAERFAAFMLEDFSVNGRTTFIAPAAGFYMQNSKGRQEARLAYVLERPDIEEAVKVLEAGLQAYPGRV